MPRITRSSELLNLTDGLFYIDDEVIDLASAFYNELKSIVATFGEEAIVKLVPHVSSLLSKLNNLCKENCDVKQEIILLRENLTVAESRCLDLNNSFKDKTVACLEIEDDYEGKIHCLIEQLNKVREQNVCLKDLVDTSRNVDSDRLVAESNEKITALTAERKCLLTTIEVLEADVKSLRAEIRQMEKRAKQRQSTVSVDLLAELTMSEVTLDVTNTEQFVESSEERSGSNRSDILPLPTQPGLLSPSSPPSPTSQQQTVPTVCVTSTPQDLGKVLVIGDSLLRHAGEYCCKGEAVVEFCPGGKIDDIRLRLLEHVGVNFSLIYLHVGTNNLRRGYNGGPGYNGGQGKREALHSMADLLYTVRTKFPSANVVLNSILVRRDLSYKALNNFNFQLELMCQNFGVTFMDINRVLSRRDLARDGIHLSRRGVSRLGALILETISSVLLTLEPDLPSVQEEASTSHLDLDPVGGGASQKSLSSSVSEN